MDQLPLLLFYSWLILQIALKQAGGDPSGWYVPPWTLEADRTLNAAVGNKTSILSVTAPGVEIEPDTVKARQLARTCNNYIAKLRDDDPDRYGFFATLPSLFDTEGCLVELAYAFDALQADGVTLFTRYGDGHAYLGHEAFRRIWAELNRRSAVVFIHPTHLVDTTLVNPALPQPMFDYPHETGRTAMDMIVSNLMPSIQSCKVILSHAGGTLPYLIYRPAVILPITPVSVGKSTEEIVKEAKMFYFDLAISSNPVTLKALFELAEPGHLLFGTDFPNAPTKAIEQFTGVLDGFEMDAETRQTIYWKSALRLFLRLKEYYK